MRMNLGLLLLTAACCLLAARGARADFEAAAGKVEITPSRPVYIAGYSENRKSAGVHDPLWARCLLLRSGSETVALVSCDLIGLTRNHISRIRSMIRRVPPERVLIGVTHTHSGPDTYGQWGPDLHTSGVDKEWMAEVYRKVAALVDETAARLQPAYISFGRTSDIRDCSYNARVREILDTELSALQVMNEQGRTVCTLVNYACHPEVLNNHQITSDFPYWLRARLEEKLGGIALYMNGAQGGMVTADIKNEESFPRGEAWPEAERIGNTLADAALSALTDAVPDRNPTITFGQRVFRVPLKNEKFRALIKMGILPGDFMDGEDIVTEVSRFTVGPAEFLTLPGEVLPNIGLYLKRQMSGQPRFLLGLTGDALGYILTPEDYGLKLYSYESSVSIGPDMGRRMEENLLALLNSAKRAGRP